MEKKPAWLCLLQIWGYMYLDKFVCITWRKKYISLSKFIYTKTFRDFDWGRRFFYLFRCSLSLSFYYPDTCTHRRDHERYRNWLFNWSRVCCLFSYLFLCLGVSGTLKNILQFGDVACKFWPMLDTHGQ